MKYIQFSTNQLLFIVLAIIPLVGTQFMINKFKFLLYIDIFLKSTSMIFAIIPQIIINRRTQKRKTNQLELNQKMRTTSFDKVTEKQKFIHVQICCFFFIIGILHFFYLLLFSLINGLQVFGFGNTITFLCLSITWVACYYILKHHFYLHHFLGLGIVLIGAILEISLLYENFNSVAISCNVSFQSCLILFVCYIIFSPFKEVIEKHLMTKYFFSSNTLLIVEGTLSLFIVIILTLINENTNCDNRIFKIYCEENKWKELKLQLSELFDFKYLYPLYTFLTILLAFFSSYLLMEINKRLTPMHKYITDNFAGVIFHVVSIFQTLIINFNLDFIYTMLVFISLSLISTIGCFIFNEYIILTFCHLNRDTQKEIKKRAENEEIFAFELNCSTSTTHDALFKQ